MSNDISGLTRYASASQAQERGLAEAQDFKAFEEFQMYMMQAQPAQSSGTLTPAVGSAAMPSASGGTANPLMDLIKTVDEGRTRLHEALAVTAANPTRANMVDSMRRLSELDLSATLAGKIADKATKGLDRILNLQ